MSESHIAIVTRDERARIAAAKAFDGAPSDWVVRISEEMTPADVVVVGPDVVPAEADVVFDPEHPVEVLDEVAERLRRRRRCTVMVTGAGGGAGATTVALHLAASAARRGLDTCLVDLDASRSAVDVRLGLPDAVVFDPDEAMPLRLAARPVGGGFRLLRVADTGADPRHLVTRVRDEFGATIVDGTRLEYADVASVAIVVMPPSPVGVARAKSLLGDALRIPTAVVTNRVGPGGDLTKRSLERLLGRRVTANLPCTPALRDAEEEGRLLISVRHRWWRTVDRLGGAVSAL